MNAPDETAISAAIASPAPADRAEALHDRAALGDRDEGDQPEHREQRAAGELRADADGELALEEAGGRPGDRRQRDVDAPAPALAGEIEGRSGRGHPGSESPLRGRSA